MATLQNIPADSRRKALVAQVDKHGYLFGQKLAASMSPLLHSIVYAHLGLNWAQFRLDSLDLDHFLHLARHDPNFYGASVTMPHKVAIMAHLDKLTPECRAVGACNTLFLQTDTVTGQRLLCGANTDVVGVRDAFLHNMADAAARIRGRPGLIIGGGGAARSAVYALQQCLGASEVYLVNRDPKEVEALIAECRTGSTSAPRPVHVASTSQAELLGMPAAIVACVPDLPPKTDGEKLAREITRVFLSKKEKGAMLEMCYNPSPYTELGELAERNGWQVILGTEALIYQGLEQDRYWTGRSHEEMPLAEARRIIGEEVAARGQLQAKLSVAMYNYRSVV